MSSVYIVGGTYHCRLMEKIKHKTVLPSPYIK